MLNSGDVPNLFPYDERVQITEATRPHAVPCLAKLRATCISRNSGTSSFRVRARLHVVLAFSPSEIHSARLRLSLINCCTIDWPLPGHKMPSLLWPKNSSVMWKCLVMSSTAVTGHASISTWQSQTSMSSSRTERRINYVTPTSYLELIQAFRTSLAKKREEVSGAHNRYVKGLTAISRQTSKQ